MSYNPFEHIPPPISILLKQSAPSDTANISTSTKSGTTTSKLIDNQSSKHIPSEHISTEHQATPLPSPFSNIESEVEISNVPLDSKKSETPSISYVEPIIDTDLSFDGMKVEKVEESFSWCSISSLCCILLILLILIIVGYYLYRWYYRSDVIVTKPEDETPIKTEIDFV